MRVTRLVDDVIEHVGYPARDGYVEKFWLPILGPTATLLLRRLALEIPLGTNEIDNEALAAELGVHVPVLLKTIDRLVRFDVARTNGDIVAVRTFLPRLPQRLLDRLPLHLQEEHH